jgi:hypothetical protein
MAPFVLRHRLIINSGDLTADAALRQVLDSIPSPVPTLAEDAPVATPTPAHAHATAASGLEARSLMLTDAPPVTELGPSAG